MTYNGRAPSPSSCNIPPPSCSLLSLAYKVQPCPTPNLVSYPLLTLFRTLQPQGPSFSPFFLTPSSIVTSIHAVSSTHAAYYQVHCQAGSSFCFRSQLNCPFLSRKAFSDHPSFNTPCHGLFPSKRPISFFSGLITNRSSRYSTGSGLWLSGF